MVWLAVTSAPLVTVEMPIRPVIGAVTFVQPRLMRAASTAAWSCLTVACGLLVGGLGVVGVLFSDRVHA